MLLRTLFVTCLLASTASAKPIVIKAAHLFDGKSDKLVSPGVVVVDNGKITAAGAKVTEPAGAEVIDLGNATLMPGLMDAHTHLSHERSDDWKQDELDYFKKPPTQFALEASVLAKRTLLAGVTTVRDLGSWEQIDVGLRDAIAEGTVVGPRMLVATNAISARGGHCDPNAGYRPGIMPEPGIEAGVADGPIRFARRCATTSSTAPT